jgi:DNA polymerase-3 subunit gamma/tau
MAYQVLARKWRPQNFSSLVGQEPIVTALRNALAEGRIAHAYLFSGIRGVGKTTAARVLAKALNCERGPAADPCNECTSCVEIARGSDLDVLEVDAATYSKVEQVRDLTESLRYGPARDRYKVVVLDEVHRLSRQAFDALLKIVEEPPPYLVFIFATTEIEAVPATILSRCQEFQFRRVPAQAVATLLREICDSEAIQATDSALRLVARAGEGSVRDAVALLDQLATFGSSSISDEAAIRLLGGLDLALFRRLLGSILSGDSPAVSAEVHHVEDEGWDPRHVYGQFLGYCRDALHLALGTDPATVDMPLEEAQALAELAGATGYENLLRLLNQLLASESTIRRTETGALALEIAWLRAAELPKLVRIEELLAGTSPSASSSFASAASRPTPVAATPPARTTTSAPPPRTAAAPPSATPAAPPYRPPTPATANSPTAPAAPAPSPYPAPAAAPATPRPAPAPAQSAVPGSETAANPATPAPSTPTPSGSSAPAPAPATPAPPASRPTPAIPSPPASGATPASPSTPGGATTAPSATPDSAAPAPAPDASDAAVRTAPPAPTRAAPAAAPRPGASQSAPSGAAGTEAFLHEVSARRQPLAAHLEAAQLRFQDGCLTITAPRADPYLSSRLRQQANLDTVAEAVARVWGTDATWELVEGPEAAPTPAPPGGLAPTPGSALPTENVIAEMNPAVQTLLDIFGGKVEAVEEHSGAREE